MNNNLYDFGDLMFSWLFDIIHFFNIPLFKMWDIECSLLNMILIFVIINMVLDLFYNRFGLFEAVDDGLEEFGDFVFEVNNPDFTEVDGYIVDTETGEVL